MKRIMVIVFFAIIGLNTAQVSAHESKSNDVAVSNSAQALSSTITQEEMQGISNRVNEIRSMDKSNLTLAQRKELKQELMSMKEKAKKADGAGIYIGGSAALILLIVLLIVLI